MDKSQVGLSGEFYVLAQLAHRGLVGTLTLGNTKGIDILVTNAELDRLYKVEVKTTCTRAGRERLFGDEKFYSWTMGKKHESIRDHNLYYVFVQLRYPDERPNFFIVPSVVVAEYVKWQHEHWLSTRGSAVKDTSMRRFRIQVDDPDGHEDNWDVFLK